MGYPSPDGIPKVVPESDQADCKDVWRMNYYPFHVGDYTLHTLHLTPMEDLAYRRMIDWCFTHETPLPKDPVQVAKLIRLSEHLTDVERTLNEFFSIVETGWENKRIASEIERYYAKKKQQSAAGKASVQAKLNKRSTGVKRAFNQPEPEPNIYTPPITGALLQDFMQVRKAKRAGALTETAFNGIIREAGKAGITTDQAVQVCCERGWTSFKAEWLTDRGKPASGQQARQSNGMVL